MTLSRKHKIFLIVGFVTLVFDQITKYWARNSLPGVGQSVEVIENFWAWKMSWNFGSAFGMFSGTGGARIFLTVIGLVALGAIFWMVKQARDDQTKLHWAYGLVFGGAIGNIFDRIYFGKVTDFIVWKYYEKEWPTFNIADVALVVGVLLLVFDFKKDEPSDTKAAKAKG